MQGGHGRPLCEAAKVNPKLGVDSMMLAMPEPWDHAAAMEQRWLEREST